MREISDNVKEKVTATINELVPLNSIVISHMTKPFLNEVINIYLTECWQVFDAFDSDTWPKDQFRKEYLLKFRGEGDVVYYKVGKWNHKKRWFQIDFKQITPVSYLDIVADIMPEGM